MPLATVERMTLAPPRACKAAAGSLGLAIDVMVGPQLSGQGLLFLTAGDGRYTKAHPVRELDGQVPKPADALDRHEIAGPGG